MSTQKYFNLLNDSVNTICVLFKTYPGSCGPSVSRVENLLLSNLKPGSKLDSKVLAKCYCLIPRLGSGGHEGRNHRANFLTHFQKLSFTLEDFLTEIFAMISYKPQNNSVNIQRSQEPLQLPVVKSSDMLKKSLYLQSQFSMVSECMCALIKVLWI